MAAKQGGGVGAQAASPDGKTLYFAEGESLLALDLETGVARTIATFPGWSIAWCLACSPDAAEVAFVQTTTWKPGMTHGQTRLCALRVHQPESLRELVPQVGASPCLRWELNRVVDERYRDGPMRLELRDLANADLLGTLPLKAQKRVGNASPSLAPDGDRVAYVLDIELKVGSFASGDASTLALVADHPSWSPDGTQIAFMKEDAELWIARPDTHDLERFLAADGEMYSISERHAGHSATPTWSPDGRLLHATLTRWTRLADHPEGFEQWAQKTEEDARARGVTYQAGWREAHLWLSDTVQCLIDFRRREFAVVREDWRQFLFLPGNPAP